MQNVLVFAGTLQSGKSSAAKFVTGTMLKQAGIVDWFDISPEGDLLVEAIHEDGNKTRDAILDVYRDDYEFAQYAYQNIYPHSKIYSFARELKESAIGIFGLNRKFVYGSQEDKNQPSTVKWINIWSLLSKDRKEEVKKKYPNYKDLCLTHREVLQEFGTLCRIIDNDCWVNANWRKIEAEGYPYCIIDDCRYLNEIEVSKKNGAKIVLLERQPIKDSHNSEKVLTFDRSLFDFVIPEDMNLERKNEELTKILNSIGWISATLQ